MQCGAKCFIVEVEHEEMRKEIKVKARSATLARKAVRREYDSAAKIVSVKAQKS